MRTRRTGRGSVRLSRLTGRLESGGRNAGRINLRRSPDQGRDRAPHPDRQQASAVPRLPAPWAPDLRGGSRRRRPPGSGSSGPAWNGDWSSSRSSTPGAISPTRPTSGRGTRPARPCLSSPTAIGSPCSTLTGPSCWPCPRRSRWRQRPPGRALPDLVEQVVVRDREVEAIEWTPPARPFFEKRQREYPQGVLRARPPSDQDVLAWYAA